MQLLSIKDKTKRLLENEKIKPFVDKIKPIWKKISPWLAKTLPFVLYFIPTFFIFYSINCITSHAERRWPRILEIDGFFKSWIFPLTALAVLWAALIVKSALKKRTSVSVWSLGIYFALTTYLFSETVICADAIKWNWVFIICAPLIVYFLFLPGAFLFKKPIFCKIYYGVIATILSLYSVLNFYVYEFRGAAIRASDINNITSAAEISSDYSFVDGAAPYVLLLTAVFFVNFILVCVFFKINPIKPAVRIGFASGFAVLLLALVLLTTRIFDYGFTRRIICLNYSGFEDMTTTQDVGNHLFIFLDVTNGVSKKPDNYSKEKAEQILSQYPPEKETDKKPTVIVIMDESFADFALLAQFETNRDYIPFYNNLKENTIKGHVTVSAYGGYSCNSEFEFLTGNTMGFYSMGDAAYTQYLKTPQDSLVNYFKGRGYETVAMAGCSPGVWNLQNAYNLLGFEKQFYSGDYRWKAPEYVNGRISDKTFFGEIISYYENKRNENDPMFLFATTMQNHSPYQHIENPSITLPDIDSPEGEWYLSSIYETDQAIKQVVEYFSNVDEDVVICFFGDHYPNIPQFSEQLLDGEIGALSIEQNAAIHSTPYFIWANYDIEEKQGEDMSLNYLSNTLLEVCGAPKTDFHLYLETVKEQVPFISVFGYKGKDGKWYRTGEKSAYSDKLNEYNCIQYYRVSDKYS